MSNTARKSTPTTVTVKGQVTLPKAVREAAGIRPGDKVVSRALPEGGVLIERAQARTPDDQTYRKTLLAIAGRRPFRGMTTDETMRLTRGEE